MLPTDPKRLVSEELCKEEQCYSMLCVSVLNVIAVWCEMPHLVYNLRQCSSIQVLRTQTLSVRNLSSPTHLLMTS